MNNTLLSVDKLNAKIQNTEILKNFSLEIGENEIYYLIFNYRYVYNRLI
jgi:Fe-S cluster assembly ATPase SufC